MLNLSENNIYKRFDKKKFSAFDKVSSLKWEKWLIRSLLIFSVVVLIFLLLPWTQNVSSKGYLTTLYPDQRPQTVHSVIAGRLEKWYVKEGDFVNEGDTLVYISEVKSDYFDPSLVNRTTDQVNFKSVSIEAYGNKVKALQRQLKAFQEMKALKVKQVRNKLKQAKIKVKSDSVDFVSMDAQLKIAERQQKRIEDLYQRGLKSLRDVESANVKLQETAAKTIAQENKLIIARNELINAQIDYTNVESEYLEKISKVESEINSVISDQQEASSSKSKLENQLSNYKIRQGFYYVTAPNTGFVTKLVRSGVGEVIKEGEELLTVMPDKYDLAVEFYIEPMNYPLIKRGEHVRLQFDGWPAVVFGGWPDASFGTFGGKILAIDNFTSSNGMYRVLAIPEDNDKKWPKGLRVGGGVKTFTLLNDVPVWYELWRNLNGFPPEFYEGKVNNNSLKKGKK
jgi:adhesin transport system membrane fusion protein